MLKLGILYLIPVPITIGNELDHIPEKNLKIVRALKYFISENAKVARANLKLFGYDVIQSAQIEELNQHSLSTDTHLLLEPLLKGHDLGLMSDAGCPAIADPGAAVVKLAHQKGIQVVPLSGPSSIVLSIMASGFNGQNFAFVGYLPLDKVAKIKRIKDLETLAVKQKQAQFFIETPYRNEQIFDLLLSSLSNNTMLFIGRDLTGSNENVISLKIEHWKKRDKLNLNKIPVVFGIYAD